MDGRTYLEKVDETLGFLRDKCLGFQNPYELLLPRGGKNWDPERRARYISGMLLFAFAKSTSVGLGEASLQRLAEWFYYLILYFETHCSPDSRKFSAMHLLTEVEADVRMRIFHEEPFRVLADMPVELLGRDLDLAMWSLLENRKEGKCAIGVHDCVNKLL